MLKQNGQDSTLFVVCRAGPYDALVLTARPFRGEANTYIIDTLSPLQRIVIRKLEWLATAAEPCCFARNTNQWNRLPDDNALAFRPKGDFHELPTYVFKHNRQGLTSFILAALCQLILGVPGGSVKEKVEMLMTHLGFDAAEIAEISEWLAMRLKKTGKRKTTEGDAKTDDADDEMDNEEKVMVELMEDMDCEEKAMVGLMDDMDNPDIAETDDWLKEIDDADESLTQLHKLKKSQASAGKQAEHTHSVEGNGGSVSSAPASAGSQPIQRAEWKDIVRAEKTESDIPAGCKIYSVTTPKQPPFWTAKRPPGKKFEGKASSTFSFHAPGTPLPPRAVNRTSAVAYACCAAWLQRWQQSEQMTE